MHIAIFQQFFLLKLKVQSYIKTMEFVFVVKNYNWAKIRLYLLHTTYVLY